MEVKVGIQQSPRELVVESVLTPDEVSALVAKALKDGGVLSLEDDKGRRLVIPAEKIAYVEIARAEPRRVGFGA